MKKSEIKRILKRHPGSKAEVARRSGVKHNAVSMWLAGGTNANVAAHAEQHACELLAEEQGIQRTGEANGPIPVVVLAPGKPAIVTDMRRIYPRTAAKPGDTPSVRQELPKLRNSSTEPA